MNVKPPDDRVFVRSAAFFEGTIGAVAALLAWWLGVPVGRGWQLGFWSVATGLAATAPLLAVMWLTLRWPLGPFRELKALVDDYVAPLFRGGSLIDFALISLLAGVGEELLFRGVIQRGLSASWGPWIGFIIAAALFGLCHALNTGYLFLATAIGVYLGWLERATGNLAVPIIAHTVYDFVALVYLVRIRPPRCDTQMLL